MQVLAKGLRVVIAGMPVDLASRGTRRHLDDFDRAMIEFVLLWVPYGGPPVDEILPRFGILGYELPDRIREIAARCLGGNVSVRDRSRIIEALDAVARSSADGHFECTGLPGIR